MSDHRHERIEHEHTGEPWHVHEFELDSTRERELRQRLTQHHRDDHLTALTCDSCQTVLARIRSER
jgi:hypothetical protein